MESTSTSQTVLFNQCGGDGPDHRVVTEAALSSSVVHPNVVSTYHYDIKQVKAKVTLRTRRMASQYCDALCHFLLGLALDLGACLWSCCL